MRNEHHFSRQDHARPHVEYATVKATLAQRTESAILLSRDDLPMAVWVPLYALETYSKIQVLKAALKTEIELRIELHMAQVKGLV